MSPTAAVACRIVSRIREREKKEIWTKKFEEKLAQESDEVLYQGMMFNLAKDRMQKTDLWKIVQRMPKGFPITYLVPMCAQLIPCHRIIVACSYGCDVRYRFSC